MQFFIILNIINMKSLFRFVIYGFTAITICSSVVIACGPVYPWRLFDNRKEALVMLPAIEDFSNKVEFFVTIDPKVKQNLLLKSSFQNCSEAGDGYQKAADLFNAGDHIKAKEAFVKIANQGSMLQQVCANYSLARTVKLLGEKEDAVQYFIQVTKLVGEGAPDPDGLGVAAYGEAAAALLEQIGNRDPSGNMWTVGEVTKESLSKLHLAVEYYANQAILLQNAEENSGANSLFVVVSGLIDIHNKNANLLLEQATADPLLQKLLLAYLLNSNFNYPSNDGDVNKHILSVFQQTLDKNQSLDGDFSVISWFAYQTNHMKEAQKFAEYSWNKNHHAIDAWILAKIALMNNHISLAQTYYHQAIRHFSDQTLQSVEKDRIMGEKAVLLTSQGSFLQAMDILWPLKDTYWDDIVYLAEKVLTIDELKNFIHNHDHLQAKQLSDSDQSSSINIARLKEILAKRLVNLSKFHDAIPYFSSPKQQQLVKQYAQYVYEMKNATSKDKKIRAAWEAAKIARYGADIMATTGQPDNVNPVNNVPYIIDEQIPEDQKLFSSQERQRVNQALPIPNRRFHYRYIGADHALYASRLVPIHSQAYAALLCNANEWLQSAGNYGYTLPGGYNPKDPDKMNPKRYETLGDVKAKEIYQLYLKKGSVFSFTAHFGQNCPEPVFSKIY